MSFRLLWRYKDEVRRKVGFSAKSKRVVPNEAGRDDECVPAGHLTMGGWGCVPSTDNLKYLGRLYDVPLEYLLHDDAPEPRDNVTADPAGASVVQRKTFRRKFLIVIVSLLVKMSVITCIYVYQNKEEVVPIDELTDDANWESSEADEFSLDC